jgi:Trp operon repressor
MEHLSSDMEQQQNQHQDQEQHQDQHNEHEHQNQQQLQQPQVQWRRDKVQELCSKGYSQREISQIFQVGVATVNRDIS